MSWLIASFLLRLLSVADFTPVVIASRAGNAVGTPFIVAPRAGSAPATTLSDSLAARIAAEQATRLFLKHWSEAWRNPKLKSVRDIPMNRRLTLVQFAHCHPPGMQGDEYATRVRKQYAPLRPSIGAFGLCPSWPLAPLAEAQDEAEGIDNALSMTVRDSVKRMRAALLQHLDSAQRLLPSDRWIAGQRVRFSIDQQQFESALQIARACTGDWWCSALGGFVLYRMHNIKAADSAFSVVQGMLPRVTRCGWSDIRLLLPAEPRLAYGANTCTPRDSLARRYWWLSKPFFSESVNERELVHHVRTVVVMLHQGLEVDEHYHWDPRFGGEAAEEMIMRYGWPTNVFWIGGQEDASHDGYLSGRLTPSSAPYSTAEYSTGRVHFAPDWSTVLDPFHASDSAWVLNAPASLRTSADGRGDFWWPDEHMPYQSAAMLQYAEMQTAIMRRAVDVDIATAIDVDEVTAEALAPLAADAPVTVQVVSEAPDSAEIVSRASSGNAKRVLVRGATRSRPFVMSIETSGKTVGGVRARTRFGVMPPPPLNALTRGAIAVSEPVFYVPFANSAPPPTFNAMLPQMLGTTRVKKGSKIGVFWENYGITSGDSVKFSVNAEYTSRRNLLKRVAAALRIVDGPPGNVAISWKDLEAGGNVTMSGGVSIVPRAIVLDLSQLSSGTYTIEIVATTTTHGNARAQRTLTIY